MASVNYRRRAGNLIDRDKRSNCRGGRARPVAIFLPRPSAKLIFDIMFTESATQIVNSYHVKLAEYFAEKVEKYAGLLDIYISLLLVLKTKQVHRLVILRNYIN